MSCRGSSPHVRGTLGGNKGFMTEYGIIPACAGNTCCRRSRNGKDGDHPRMCGEHVVLSAGHRRDQGSSPHVRGTPVSGDDAESAAGIIPACAGNTSSRNGPANANRDHPRMCGEHMDRLSADEKAWGSSPACAGNTPRCGALRSGRWDHPRMCGEHLSFLLTRILQKGSSPHVRGTLPRDIAEFECGGIIPACAGNTR